MYCTFSEAAKLLGFKSKQSLYRLYKLGRLDDFIERIDGVNYIYMRAIKGKTIAQYLQDNLFSNHYTSVNNFNADEWLKSH